MNPTTGLALVRALEQNEVEFVFGIPGEHNLELYRYLGQSTIRHISPRHEQGGGYAVDAYARASGRPGVLITTSGPGVTNAVTAVATAFADSIPMLLISPSLPRDLEGAGHGVLHEIKNQQAHVDAVCGRSIRVHSAEQAFDAVNTTFMRWRAERPRPVHIDVPLDVLSQTYEPASLEARRTCEIPIPIPPEADIRAAASALAQASAPVMVVGGGARTAGSEIRAVAERLNAPVVTTMNGKGILPETHRLSLGSTLRLGEAHRLIRAADAFLIVGAVLGDAELWGHTLRPPQVAVRLDIDSSQIEKNLMPSHKLVGSAKETLTRLLAQLPSEPSHGTELDVASVRRACASEARAMGQLYAPYHDALKQALPPETIVVGDSAQVSYLGTAHQWEALQVGQFLYPTTFGTLGYGIPGGIGASLARPQTPVVVLAGDGGTMFTIQEFMTAVDLRLPLPIVIFNNGGFQEIRDSMRRHGIPPLACDLECPDIPLLGKAFGGFGQRVSTPTATAQAVAEALERPGPTLIEVALRESPAASGLLAEVDLIGKQENGGQQ